LNGLMMAVTSFMDRPPNCAAAELRDCVQSS
jgi:hypothetical protein